MENKNFRVKVNVGQDTNIKINLKQKYDTLDILSLKIYENDIYQSTSSDWGVVIGRVVGNNGVGIPNCKISIFIPITEEDSLNPEILSIYPYLEVEDVDNNGSRYNLLPNKKYLDKFAGWISNIFGIGYKPKVPVGTFPSKEEIVSNKTILKVYEKYYRYTTTTNESGDFMLFGVPVGQQTLHMDVDLTNIGKYSMTPLVLQKKAVKDENAFSDDGTKINKSSDFTTLPNIESQNIVIDVIPFWGDNTQQEIGISRTDFKLKSEIIPNFSVIGSGFTMGSKSYWGDRIVFRMYLGLAALCFRILGKTVKINGVIPVFRFIPRPFSTYYDTINGGINDEDAFLIRVLPRSFRSVCSKDVSSQIKCGISNDDVTDNLELSNHRTGNININVVRYVSNGTVGNVDDLQVVGNNDIIKFSENGQFGAILFCNRDKKITDEFGNLIPSPNGVDGIFTKFVGYFILEIDGNIENPPTINRTDRIKMKVPQNNTPSNRNTNNANRNWILDSYEFDFGEIYSVAQYFKVFNIGNGNVQCPEPNAYAWSDYLGLITNANEEGMPCNTLIANTSNNTNPNTLNSFVNDWMNFSLYFYQFMYKTKKNKVKSRVSEKLMKKELLFDNSIPLGGGLVNTKYFVDGAEFKTDFVKIPKQDFINILTEQCSNKGFTSTQLESVGKPLQGTYKSNTNTKYFYRGLKNSDCFIFAINKGIIQ